MYHICSRYQVSVKYIATLEALSVSVSSLYSMSFVVTVCLRFSLPSGTWQTKLLLFQLRTGSACSWGTWQTKVLLFQLALGEPGKQKFFSFISGSRETWKQGLLKSFPDEEAALDKYIAKLKVAIALGYTSKLTFRN